MLKPKKHKQQSLGERLKDFRFPQKYLTAEQSEFEPAKRTGNNSRLERIGSAVISSGASEASCSELIAAVLGTSTDAGRKKVVQATNYVKKELQKELKPTSTYLCRGCAKKLKTKFSVCLNPTCKDKGQPPKRGSWLEYSWLGTYAIEPQLRPVIEKFFDRIISLHRKMHYDRERDEIRDMAHSDAYKAAIEKKEDFDNKKILLPITIGYDGFRPKGHGKLEITPLYVRVEAIGERENRDLKNVAIASLFSVRGGVSAKNANTFGDRLEVEILATKLSPWLFHRKDVQWKLTLVPTFLLGDMAGIRKVASIPDWGSTEQPCIQCDVKGVRKAGSPRYYDEHWKMRIRSKGEQERIISEKHRRNALTRLAPPWMKTSDELHLWCEGLAKNVMNALFTNDSKWKTLRVSIDDDNAINKALEGLKNYTHSRSYILSIRNKSGHNGSEIRELMRVCIPIIGIFGFHSDVRVRIFIILIYGLTHGIYACESREKAVKLRNLGNIVHHLHGSLSLETYTLKAHDIYLHAADSIAQYGRWRSQSTSEMERYHKQFHHYAVTGSSSMENMASRFFGTQLLKRRKVEKPEEESEEEDNESDEDEDANEEDDNANVEDDDDNVEDDGYDEGTLQRDMRSEKWQRGMSWPVELDIDGNIKFPKKSRVPFEIFNSQFPDLAEKYGINNDWKIYSRCIVKEVRYTSKLWKADTSTIAYQGIAANDQYTSYGTIIAFLLKNDQSFVLFQEWSCSNPWEEVVEELGSVATAEEKEQLHEICSSNSSIVEKEKVDCDKMGNPPVKFTNKNKKKDRDLSVQNNGNAAEEINPGDEEFNNEKGNGFKDIEREIECDSLMLDHSDAAPHSSSEAIDHYRTLPKSPQSSTSNISRRHPNIIGRYPISQMPFPTTHSHSASYYPYAHPPSTNYLRTVSSSSRIKYQASQNESRPLKEESLKTGTRISKIYPSSNVATPVRRAHSQVVPPDEYRSACSSQIRNVYPSNNLSSRVVDTPIRHVHSQLIPPNEIPTAYSSRPQTPLSLEFDYSQELSSIDNESSYVHAVDSPKRSRPDDLSESNFRGHTPVWRAPTPASRTPIRSTRAPTPSVSSTSSLKNPSASSMNQRTKFKVPILNVNTENGSIAAEMIIERSKGALSEKKIGDIIQKHQDDPNFSEALAFAQEVMCDKIGQLNPTEGHPGLNFLFNCSQLKQEKSLEKKPVRQLFDSITSRCFINTEFKKVFRKDGSFWKKGIKTTSSLYSYPEDGLRCISAIISYLLFDITSDPADILYFTFKKERGSNAQYIQIPKDVAEFVQDYIFESVNMPTEVLQPEFTLETLEEKAPELYNEIGATLEEKTSGLDELRRNANTLRLLIREKAAKKLSDHRYDKITRDGDEVTFVKMTKEEKKDRKDGFETKKKEIMNRMNL